MTKGTGYWKVIVEPPHQHIYPMDRLGRIIPPEGQASPGVGSVWVCPCGVELEYVGEPDGLFREVIK